MTQLAFFALLKWEIIWSWSLFLDEQLVFYCSSNPTLRVGFFSRKLMALACLLSCPALPVNKATPCGCGSLLIWLFRLDSLYCSFKPCATRRVLLTETEALACSFIVRLCRSTKPPAMRVVVYCFLIHHFSVAGWNYFAGWFWGWGV